MKRVLVGAIFLSMASSLAWAGGKDDLNAAILADQQHETDGAIEHYTNALKANDLTDADQLTAYFGRANDYRDERNYDAAIADYNKTLSLDPKNEAAYVGRATVLAYKGSLAPAIDDLTTALSLKSDDETALVDRGALYAARNEFKTALVDFNAAIKLVPDDAGAYLNRADAFHGLADDDHAIADLNMVIRLRPQLAGAYYNRGDVWRDKGDIARAIADYNTAIRLKPDYADAYNNRGTAYQLLGQYPRALADFNKALQLEPNDPSALYNRGAVYRSLGEYDDAIADYDSLIFLRPNLPPAYNGRAYANFHAEHFVAAANDFRRSLNFDASQIYTVLWLHLAALRAGQADGEEFSSNLQHVDMQDWPAPIAEYLIGKATAAQVLVAAAKGDPKMRAARACDANFFLGEVSLAQQRSRAARHSFFEARKVCPITSPSFTGVLAELRHR